jgi:hypothetical protein
LRREAEVPFNLCSAFQVADRDGELPEEIIFAPPANGQHLKPEFIFVRFRGGIGINADIMNRFQL